MRMKRLAWMSCALFSLPVIGLAAASAASSTSLTIPSQAMTPAWSSGDIVAALDASAAVAAPAQLVIKPVSLWTARDAIALPTPGPINLEAPSAAPLAPECRWPSNISNAWDCSLKPLVRYDRPVRWTLHHLWPLHGSDRKSGDDN